MNIESTTIFAELDKLTESNDNTDFAMPDELKKLYATRSNGIPSIIDVFDDTERLLNVRPCAFDDIGSKLDHEGIDEEYEEET